MVDEVMHETQIVIHQAVHGYVEGHCELWSSLRLKPRDAKAVLVYSDTSSSGLRIGEHGYLTGYPLQESGYYAIGRTWPAPEMQRPGAVWTHTLFIEFSDVAFVRDALVLLPLFRRPSVSIALEDDQAYSKPIEITSTEAIDFSLDGLNCESWYRQVVSCLYGFPESKVIASFAVNEVESIERCVLALWSQQWPRLRRAFRFCTLTSADRSTDRAIFDLQLVPDTERGIRGKFSSAILAHEVQNNSSTWTQHLVDDLQSPVNNGLRKFLHQVGADISRGRRAMVPLARLHKILSSHEAGQSAWTEAIDLLGAVSQGGLLTIDQIVVSAAIKNAKKLDKESLEYVLKRLSIVSRSDVERYAAHLGCTVWKVSPKLMAELYGQNEFGKLILEAALCALPVEELIDGLGTAHEIADLAFERRPEILENESIWNSSSRIFAKAINFASKDSNILSRALVKIVGSGVASIIPQVFAVLGADRVWEYLAVAADGVSVKGEAIVPWLGFGAHYPDALARVLSSARSLNRQALVSIAQATNPDLVPNAYGDDPWAIALNAAHGYVSPFDENYLNCYLLARALGPQSRNIAALVEISFSTVYGAVAAASLSPESWFLIECRIPSTNSWQNWDRCQQIVVAIAQRYVRSELSMASFGRLGKSEVEFSALVDAAAREWGGRGYLRGVKRELRVLCCSDFDRLRIVEKAVSSWF